MLEVSNLSVAYGKHSALRNVALSVRPGEIVVMLGANGAGKSTLLKAVAGLVPHDGQAVVRLSGQDIAATPAHRIVELGIALVPEDGASSATSRCARTCGWEPTLAVPGRPRPRPWSACWPCFPGWGNAWTRPPAP